MRPTKSSPARRRTSSSPPRDRPDDDSVQSAGLERVPAYGSSRRRRYSKVAASSLLLDGQPGFTAVEETDDAYGGAAEPNPRSFPYSVKQQCWEKAEKVKGRDPERWRRDAVGNIVFRKLVGCPGCLCHDYDHILPYSKGGKSTLDNCQVLQATVNRSKGNNTEISKSELIQKSAYCRVQGRDMDLIELSAYGNVRRTPDSEGCSIQ